MKPSIHYQLGLAVASQTVSLAEVEYQQHHVTEVRWDHFHFEKDKEALQLFLKTGHCKTVHLAVSANEVVQKICRFNAILTLKDIQSELLTQPNHYLQTSWPEPVIDFAKLNHDTAAEHEWLATATNRQTIDQKIETAHQLKLRPTSIEPECYALLRVAAYSFSLFEKTPALLLVHTDAEIQLLLFDQLRVLGETSWQPQPFDFSSQTEHVISLTEELLRRTQSEIPNIAPLQSLFILKASENDISYQTIAEKLSIHAVLLDPFQKLPQHTKTASLSTKPNFVALGLALRGLHD